jgi:hypothetical protein
MDDASREDQSEAQFDDRVVCSSEESFQRKLTSKATMGDIVVCGLPRGT